MLDSRDGGTQALGIADLRMTNVEELYRDPVTDIQNFMSDEDDNVYGYVFGIGKPERRILDPKHPEAVLLILYRHRTQELSAKEALAFS